MHFPMPNQVSKNWKLATAKNSSKAIHGWYPLLLWKSTAKTSEDHIHYSQGPRNNTKLMITGTRLVSFKYAHLASLLRMDLIKGHITQINTTGQLWWLTMSADIVRGLTTDIAERKQKNVCHYIMCQLYDSETTCGLSLTMSASLIHGLTCSPQNNGQIMTNNVRWQYLAVWSSHKQAIGLVSYLIYVSMRHSVLTTSGDIDVCFYTAVCLSC